MDHLFLQIAAQFTAAPQLLWTQVLMIAWSVSDLVLIFALLRIAGLARAHAGKPEIRLRYALLALTALLVPGLAFTRTMREILILESAITIPQYLILIVSLAVERRTLFPMVEARMRSARETRPPAAAM